MISTHIFRSNKYINTHAPNYDNNSVRCSFFLRKTTWLAAQEDVFDNFSDVRTAKSTFYILVLFPRVFANFYDVRIKIRFSLKMPPFFVFFKYFCRPCYFRCFLQSNEKTASKSVNNFSSYLRTNIHTYTHTWVVQKVMHKVV